MILCNIYIKAEYFVEDLEADFDLIRIVNVWIASTVFWASFTAARTQFVGKVDTIMLSPDVHKQANAHPL